MIFEAKEKESQVLEKSMPAQQDVAAGVGVDDVRADGNSTMQATVGELTPSRKKKKESSGASRGFKRIQRTKEGSKMGEEGASLEKKRAREDEEAMDVDEMDRVSKLGKLMEEANVNDLKKAGPANRSCGNQ